LSDRCIGADRVEGDGRVFRAGNTDENGPADLFRQLLALIDDAIERPFNHCRIEPALIGQAGLLIIVDHTQQRQFLGAPERHATDRVGNADATRIAQATHRIERRIEKRLDTCEIGMVDFEIFRLIDPERRRPNPRRAIADKRPCLARCRLYRHMTPLISVTAIRPPSLVDMNSVATGPIFGARAEQMACRPPEDRTKSLALSRVTGIP